MKKLNNEADAAALRKEKECAASVMKMYETIVEGAPDPIFVQTEGKFAYLNPAACAFFGIDAPEELIGTEVVDIFLPEYRESVLSRIRRLNFDRQPSENFMECLFLRKDGKNVWGETKGVPIEYGGKTGGLIFMRDTTQRHAAEEALRKSESKYEILFNQATVPSLLVKWPELAIVEVNEAWVKLLEYEKVEAVGRSSDDLGITQMTPAVRQSMVEIEKTGFADNIELILHTKSGKELTVISNVHTLELNGSRYAIITNTDITQRKIAEQQLYEISEKFRKSFDYSAIGMWLTDLDGVIFDVNRKVCDIFGYTKEELEGKRYSEITFPDDIDMSTAHVRQLLFGDKKSISFDKRYIRKNGEVFWCYIVSTILTDAEGKPLNLITQIQDITKRRKMEEELNARHRLNQIVMDNLPIGISVNSFKPPLKFEYMNDNFPKFYRTTREALSGTDVFFDAVYEDPEFRQAIRGRVLDDIRSGDPERMKWENISITRKGSETRYISAYNTVVPDEDIQISIVTDETERVLALEALEKNAVRFRTLHKFDQAVIKGFESYQRIGETALAYIFELIDPDMAGIAIFHGENRFIEAVMGPKGSMEYLYTKKAMADGEAVLYRLLSRAALYDLAEISDLELIASIRRIFDIDGSMPGLIRPLYSPAGPIGILYIGRSEGCFSQPDREILPEIGFQCAMAIEQKRLQLLSEHYANDLEEMILERTTQLEAAVNELEAFTYSVSHDLRAPLRSMNGFVRILLEDYGSRLDDEGRRVCGIIESSAHQMGRLIDDLLALSRIGRSSLIIIPVNMTSMVKSVFNELTTEEQRAEMTFSVGRLPKAAVDPTLIRQVWMNLLDNAIKFSSKKQAPRIRVEGRDCGDDVVFSVSDNGAGFDMQFRDQLFDVFQRLHSIKEFDGTGVGLAIVERIIRRHGGRVWAEGKVDTGATFYFSIRKETVSDDTGSD